MTRADIERLRQEYSAGEPREGRLARALHVDAGLASAKRRGPQRLQRPRPWRWLVGARAGDVTLHTDE